MITLTSESDSEFLFLRWHTTVMRPCEEVARADCESSCEAATPAVDASSRGDHRSRAAVGTRPAKWTICPSPWRSHSTAGVFSQGSEICRLFFALALGQCALTARSLPPPFLPSFSFPSLSLGRKYEREKIHSGAGKREGNRTDSEVKKGK